MTDILFKGKEKYCNDNVWVVDAHSMDEAEELAWDDDYIESSEEIIFVQEVING